MKKNGKPNLKLSTDDTMSMNSCLEASVIKLLNCIRIEHKRQGGSIEDIHLFPGQVDTLVRFLQQSKAWIESGYKPELMPDSYAEDGTQWFDKN
jgi:hypothetical protein